MTKDYRGDLAVVAEKWLLPQNEFLLQNEMPISRGELQTRSEGFDKFRACFIGE
jgi:hypothetical protein